MDLDAELALIHQPVRLRIMGLLFKQRDVGFAATRNALALTDGNLATHTKRLEAAGLIESRRVLQGRDGFELRYRLTPAGALAFRRYILTLKAFLDDPSP